MAVTVNPCLRQDLEEKIILLAFPGSSCTVTLVREIHDSEPNLAAHQSGLGHKIT